MQFLTRRQVLQWQKASIRVAAMGYGKGSNRFHLTLKRVLDKKRRELARISTTGY